MNFKNMKELMQHLINGGAITNLDDSCKDTWVSLYKGNLEFSDGTPLENLHQATSWRPVPQEWITDCVHKLMRREK